MQKHPILFCSVDVSQSHSVRLSVHHSTADADGWIWTSILHSGEIIASGRASTVIAAQIDAQRAHEHWLHVNRKLFSVPSRISYCWEEVG